MVVIIHHECLILKYPKMYVVKIKYDHEKIIILSNAFINRYTSDSKMLIDMLDKIVFYVSYMLLQ